MEGQIDRILIDEKTIAEKVNELGQKISKDYKDKNLILISVLKGSVVFMADLMRAIKIPCEIDFLSVSSYGKGAKSSGVVKIIKDLDIELKDLDVIIVEDILDSGLTLSYIIELLKTRGVKSVKICTLLNKPERRVSDVCADYCGFDIPDEFVVGYGLDFNEGFRNLPYIGVVKPELYKN